MGSHVLFSVSLGPYGIGNNVRPLKTPADFKNLKIRVSSSLGAVRALQNMGEGTGMTLETVPWAELYNALSRGVVDGCWSTWSLLLTERQYEVLKNYTALNFLFDAAQVVVNEKKWANLPDDIKEAVNKAAFEAEKHAIELQRMANLQAKLDLAKLDTISIYYPTAQELEEFRKASDTKAIWESLAKPWLEKAFPNQNMTEKVREELERIHNEVSSVQ